MYFEKLTCNLIKRICFQCNSEPEKVCLKKCKHCFCESCIQKNLEKICKICGQEFEQEDKIVFYRM